VDADHLIGSHHWHPAASTFCEYYSINPAYYDQHLETDNICPVSDCIKFN
jgi:hypothetical protein